MDDAFGMRRIQSIGDLNRQFQQGLGRERLPLNAVFKRPALQKLHGDEGPALVLVDFVNGADVGMIERRGGAGFALESLQGLRVFGEFFRQELQGDAATEFGVLGLVYNPHPPAAQLFAHTVVRYGLTQHVMEFPGSNNLRRGREICQRKRRSSRGDPKATQTEMVFILSLRTFILSSRPLDPGSESGSIVLHPVVL